MPAIEISRLHARINLLTKLVDDPARMAAELSNFYESYADLTFQSGLFSVKTGDFPAYRTPALMNRELESAFAKLEQEKPEKILELVDILSSKPQKEPRQLAASLLGNFSASFFNAVMLRLEQWALSTEDPEDLVWIFKLGTNRIRIEAPELWLKALRSWLDSSDPQHRQVAVYGLNSMITDTSLTSLPLIFKYLQPLLLDPNPKTLPHLETILEKLIAKSENETLFFIKQVMNQSKSPLVMRMIRRNLSLFSSEGQDSLRVYLRTLQTPDS